MKVSKRKGWFVANGCEGTITLCLRCTMNTLREVLLIFTLIFTVALSSSAEESGVTTAGIRYDKDSPIKYVSDRRFKNIHGRDTYVQIIQGTVIFLQDITFHQNLKTGEIILFKIGTKRYTDKTDLTKIIDITGEVRQGALAKNTTYGDLDKVLDISKNTITNITWHTKYGFLFFVEGANKILTTIAYPIRTGNHKDKLPTKANNTTKYLVDAHIGNKVGAMPIGKDKDLPVYFASGRLALSLMLSIGTMQASIPTLGTVPNSRIRQLQP